MSIMPTINLTSCCQLLHGLLLVLGRKHCLMTSLLMWCPSHLHGKQLPSTPNKTPYFNMNISVSKFNISFCYRVSLHLKEYGNTYSSWLLSYIRIQPLTPDVNLYGIYNFRLHHSLSQRNCEKSHHKSVLG